VFRLPPEATNALSEADARLAGAHSALTGFLGLLRHVENLNDVSGPDLAALLQSPIGEIAMAADEVRAAAAASSNIGHDERSSTG
jgi:hypothetical protein